MTPPRASSPESTRKVPVRRAVVIGGGISGLASAALLARDGFAVTVLEQRTQLGGRAGSWERDGFRFDTGPSWYLMPEVFDHFFQLLGTSADEQLDLVKLDPGYRVYSEGHDEPIDLRASREDNLALFESIEPGAGARMAKYLDSAADTYDMAVRRFLYGTFQDLRKLAAPDVLLRMGKLARLLLQPLSSFAATAVRDRRLLAGPRLPGGVPRHQPVLGAEHVPPDEPPRPGRRRALPEGRHHRGHLRRRTGRPCRGCADRHRRPGRAHRGDRRPRHRGRAPRRPTASST